MPDQAALEELVRKHRAYWRTYPWQIVRSEELVTIGFAIELYGTYDHPAHPPHAGCDECLRVYNDLHRIAEAVIAGGHEPTERTIEGYEPRVTVPPGSERQDVECRILVIHHEGYDLPVDDCERICVREITAKLRELGAREGNS